MHGKEVAIAPSLKTKLQIELKVARNLDTDQFGTFSGEVERKFTPEETARLKIQEVFRLNPSCRVAIASEGSFFPNPEFMLSTVNEELLLLIDRKTDVEAIVRYYSSETNMAMKEVSSFEETLQFAQKFGFPQHGVILKANKGAESEKIFKGITTVDALKKAFTSLVRESPEGKLILETDMRACYNPTRMKKIALAAEGLVQCLLTVCPLCNFPGFGITEYRKGLPCELCNTPTRLILSHIYQCRNCKYIFEKIFPDIKQFAYAGFCYYCNP